MGNMYIAPITANAYSTARTIVQINAGSDVAVRLIEAHVTNTLSETSTQESILIKRVTTAGTGTAVTEEPLHPRDATPGSASVTENHTAEGTLDATLLIEGFNILTGWHYVPTPEARPVIAPSGRLAITFAVAPTSATFSGYVVYEEIG